ncbi:GntR family transcriptional regulator [Enterococcus sp. HY326]|uniref:GntR family transcriptional regulator n=1 Tax=Enterococcus sp. HY326 TaxID=2971265 RepID=UPI00223FDCBB|nr:GntR family transcriptional regulator [Enterococcus sp. HY326]
MTIPTKQPLYSQMVEKLKLTIATALNPGDQLPSEHDLIADFNVSRTTVRLALKELERLGYIYRKKGKGSFVSDRNQKMTNLSKNYSFTEQMELAGKKAQTLVLEFSIVPATCFLANALRVKQDEEVIRLKRLRCGDGEPMMLELSFLPQKKFAQLTLEMIEAKPLYDIFFEEFHEVIRFADEEFYASVASKEDAELLNISCGSPVLNLVRTTYSDENEVIEYTLSVARGDLFHYKYSFKQ